MESRTHSKQILIGLSTCLIGEPVRYDGGHKRNGFIADQLCNHVKFLTICPETAIGLPVPRPPIRLVGHPDRPQVLGVQDPTFDVTRRLETFSNTQCSRLSEISGYILKKDSPSCGMERVKVYSEKGDRAVRTGTGVFARILMEQYPLLPIEEEGRLNDPVLRENFINRIFAYHQWQQLQTQGVTPSRLIEFHSRYKYQVMAHSQAAYKRMGKLLSDLSKAEIQSVAEIYVADFMATLKRRVNRKRNANVLQHIMGYLKRKIEADDKVELLNSIEAYRSGEIPLIVPITLLQHYFRRFPDPYMQKQSYFCPHPAQLGLRNTL